MIQEYIWTHRYNFEGPIQKACMLLSLSDVCYHLRSVRGQISRDPESILDRGGNTTLVSRALLLFESRGKQLFFTTKI